MADEILNQNPAATTGTETPNVEIAPVVEAQVKEEIPENIFSGEGGINLLPQQTKAEKVIEGKKSKFSLGGAFSILALVAVTVLIVGFNLYMKLQLNKEKNTLFALESTANSQSSTISTNNAILRRIDLYEGIKEKTYSPKEVMLYWQGVSSGLVDIETIELTSGLSFSVNGSASSLDDVARFWHLLSVDEKVSTVNLKSVSKLDSSVSFTFEGELNFEKFTSTDGK